MKTGYSFIILCLVAVGSILAQEKYGLSYIAEQMNTYCSIRGSENPATAPIVSGDRVGKAGPPGRPGERGATGVVNYTAINEMIEGKLKTASKKNPSSCMDVTRQDAKAWNVTGGLFDIYPTLSGAKLEVYCDVTTDGGGWTVFQRRMDGSENFNRQWDDYIDGFGKANKEYWMGLERLHQLTILGQFELRVDISDWSQNNVYAVYSDFSVGDSGGKYRLRFGTYSGNAGDSLSTHRNRKFTTTDSDNDDYNRANCAEEHGGGWWFGECDTANLNGVYKIGGAYTGGNENGVEWGKVKGARWYSMKFTEMKFRPVK